MEQLYQRYYNVALIYTSSLCGDPSLAEDLVADAFVKAYISLPDDSPSFKYWLLRVCKNAWIDHIRKNKNLASDKALQFLSSAVTPESIYLTNEKHKALWKAIETLSVQERELVILHYFSGCSLQEAAQILGKNYPAVRKHISRLRQKLKQRMEEQGYDI